MSSLPRAGSWSTFVPWESSYILHGQCLKNGSPEAATTGAHYTAPSGGVGQGGGEAGMKEDVELQPPDASLTPPRHGISFFPSSEWMMQLPASSRLFTQAHTCPLLTVQLKASLGSLVLPSLLTTV